jgi:hypothetical protein
LRTTVDARFEAEASAMSLRFRCDDCAYFDDTRARCSHGYPTAPHRPIGIKTGSVVIFCKEFELGGEAS